MFGRLGLVWFWGAWLGVESWAWFEAGVDLRWLGVSAGICKPDWPRVFLASVSSGTSHWFKSLRIPEGIVNIELMHGQHQSEVLA